MKVFAVYECRVAEYEESYGVVSIHSSEAKAKEAIAEYEKVAADWKSARAEYSIEEYELDSGYSG
jgi:hypothetical protein